MLRKSKGPASINDIGDDCRPCVRWSLISTTGPVHSANVGLFANYSAAISEGSGNPHVVFLRRRAGSVRVLRELHTINSCNIGKDLRACWNLLPQLAIYLMISWSSTDTSSEGRSFDWRSVPRKICLKAGMADYLSIRTTTTSWLLLLDFASNQHGRMLCWSIQDKAQPEGVRQQVAHTNTKSRKLRRKWWATSPKDRP